MKQVFICLALILTIQKAFTQERPYVQFNYVIPDSYETAYEADRILVYNHERKICVIIYSPYKAGENIGENFMQLWNTPQKDIEGYFTGEVNRRNITKVNGYQMMEGAFEAETNSGIFIKTLRMYQDGNSCNAVITFADRETNEQLQSFWKSLQIIPKEIPISPLQKAYNWYSIVRGTTAASFTPQSFQALNNLNFTGFFTPNGFYMQTLGDSLFHLRVLPNLQILSIGQSQFSTAAAINIGSLPALKQVDAVNQGMQILMSDAGLQGLSRSSTLEEIRLITHSMPNVTNAGMVHLARMTKLKSLFLGRADAVTIVGLEQLVSLKQLINLDLSGANLTDADIPRIITALGQMTSLQVFIIRYSLITDAGAEQIRTARAPLVVIR